MRSFIPLSLSNTGYMDWGNSGRWTCFAGCKPLTDVWSIIIQLILVSTHLNSKRVTIKSSFVRLFEANDWKALDRYHVCICVCGVCVCVSVSVCACAHAFIHVHTTIHAHVEARGQHQGISSFLLNLIFIGSGNWTQDLVHLKQELCHWAILISPDFILWDGVSN